MWIHFERSVPRADYLTLITAAGARQTLSAEHYTFAVPSGCGPASSLLAGTRALTAADVRVGHGMWVLTDAASALVCSDVVKIEASVGHDMYVPFTLSGTVIVDGVLASVSTTYAGLNKPLFGAALAARLPSLQVDALTPFMTATHLRLFQHVYRRYGQRGLDVIDALNAPLYRLAGVPASTNANVRQQFLASRPQPQHAVVQLPAANSTCMLDAAPKRALQLAVVAESRAEL